MKNGDFELKSGTTVIPAAEYTVGYTNNTNAGTATVTITDKSGGNYSVGKVTKTFTISKAASSVTKAPTAKSLTYTGKAQALIAAGTATGGAMQYSLDNKTYAKTIPTGTKAATYTVYYKVVGDANHKDTTAKSVKVTVKDVDQGE